MNSFLWAGAALLLLIWTQRWIHRHLHGLAFLLTGSRQWAVAFYAIILFPGVLLHEASHWLMAKLLWVRTGRVSLLPKAKRGGAIQLGYVEYYRDKNLGPIRESLIGAAPLAVGTLAVLLIGFYLLGIVDLAEAALQSDPQLFAAAFGQLWQTPDFFLWLYLIFAISNAMMPSPSDRKAWPAFLALLALLAAIFHLAGWLEGLISSAAGSLQVVLSYLGLAFSLTIGVNLFFILLIAGLELLVSRVKGVELLYRE